MIFNGELEVDKIKSRERLEWFLKNKKRFELTEKKKQRTSPQNRYLHLILSYFALEVGETLAFIKHDMFKVKVNPETFETERKNPKSGNIRKDWISTADLDTGKMSQCIEKFKNWTVTNTGIRLPDANEHHFLDHVQNEIDKNKQWL